MQKHNPTFNSAKAQEAVMNQTELSQQQVFQWMHLVLAVLVYKNRNFEKYADINILLHDIKVGRISGYYPVENLWEITSAESETLRKVSQLPVSEKENLVEYGQCFAMKRLYSVYQEDDRGLVQLFDEVRKSCLRLAA